MKQTQVRKMKIPIMITMLALIMLAACAPAQEAQEKKVKVGLIIPMTGGQSYAGEGTRKGFELAMQEINNLEVIYEDEQSDAKMAVNAFTKLTDINGVKIVIGPVLSGSVLAVAPLAEQKKVIVLTPTAVAAKISDAGDFIFRIRETTEGHGKGVAEYANSKGLTKAAILNVNAEAGISYANEFKKYFKELGGTVVAEELYEKDAQEMRTQAEKVMNANSDFVYFPGFAPDIGLSMKQLRQFGYTGAFLTTPAIEDKAFFKTSAGAGEGAIYTSPFDPTTPRAMEFKQKYMQTYNDPNFSWFVVNAYDALKLISIVAEKCGDDTECIKQKLYATQNYEGLSGTFSFDEKGDVDRSIVLMEVKGEAFVKLQ